MLNFDLFVDLENINDSLLLDSNEHIATLNIDGRRYELFTRGEVRVEYDGVVYRTPSEFPEPLKQAIRDGRTEDVAYIGNNNWFEIFECDKDGNLTDMSEIVDVENHTAGMVLSIMQAFAGAMEVARERDAFIKGPQDEKYVEYESPLFEPYSKDPELMATVVRNGCLYELMIWNDEEAIGRYFIQKSEWDGDNWGSPTDYVTYFDKIPQTSEEMKKFVVDYAERS